MGVSRIKKGTLNTLDTGRPSDYSQELADRICEQLAQGISLRSVCLMEGMPSIATVFSWMRKHDEFLNQYARAKEESTDAKAEMLEELGDEAIKLSQEIKGPGSTAVVQAYRLKADNIKWTMSKLKPKKYGDKVDLTSGGDKITANTFIVKDFSNGTETGDK